MIVHGIEFIRLGSCQQCGACGCDKEPCPHWHEIDGKHWCAIYNEREGTEWANCILFPDNPWIRVVRTGRCGYSFTRADGGSMDDLPFLFGKPYRVR
jgi:hypothetical protein